MEQRNQTTEDSITNRLLTYGEKHNPITLWCKHCNVPLIQPTCELCNKEGVVLLKNPLRPVFCQELKLIANQFNAVTPLVGFPDFSFFAINRNYFHKGERLFAITGSTVSNAPSVKLYKSLRHYNQDACEQDTEKLIDRMRMANQSSLNRIEYQAVEFIEEAARHLSGKMPIVSFSGGKDSSVVSHLVRLALGQKIVHIFGDTTIEYPNTYDFVDFFKSANPGTPFLTTKASKDFYELADEIGPPSRILRWCCTTHKTGPIGNLMTSLDGNGILTYDGIRKTESLRRSRYNSISFDSKIAFQVLVHPIFIYPY